MQDPILLYFILSSNNINMEIAFHLEGTFHGYYAKHERSRSMQQILCICQLDLRLHWRKKNLG